MDPNEVDLVRLGGGSLALTITLRAVLQHIERTDPAVAAAIKSQVMHGIAQETRTQEVKDAAAMLATNYLFARG